MNWTELNWLLVFLIKHEYMIIYWYLCSCWYVISCICFLFNMIELFNMIFFKYTLPPSIEFPSIGIRVRLFFMFKALFYYFFDPILAYWMTRINEYILMCNYLFWLFIWWMNFWNWSLILWSFYFRFVVHPKSG